MTEGKRKLIRQLKEFVPYNEQEERDVQKMIKALEITDNIFLRENETMHMTASGWVVNKTRDKVLMAYHKIYDSWAWLGGHADGEEDLLRVAMKEVREESGVSDLRAILHTPYSVEILTVNGHEKRGSYVSSHLHLNITYLLEADDQEHVRIKEDENSGVGWFGLKEAIEASNEQWFKQRVYPKLNARLPH